MSPLGLGALHTLGALLSLYCNAFPTCTAWASIQAVSQLTGTGGQHTWEEFLSCRQRQAHV